MLKMIRIQFELPEDKVEELERLMKEAGISTKKDLLNNAVTLFDWAVNEKRNGSIIASVNEQTGKMKELIMPALSFAETQTATIEKVRNQKEEKETQDKYFTKKAEIAAEATS